MGAGRGDTRARSALAARFGVSQGTVRKAIGALAAENLLVRRQGKGTFVATHTEETASNFRFLRIRRNDGQPRISRQPPDRPAARQGRAPRSRGARRSSTGDGVFILRRDARLCAAAGGARRDHAAGRAVQRADARALTRHTAARCTASSRPQFGVRMLRARGAAACRGRRSRELRSCSDVAAGTRCSPSTASRSRTATARSKCGAACARRDTSITGTR